MHWSRCTHTVLLPLVSPALAIFNASSYKDLHSVYNRDVREDEDASSGWKIGLEAHSASSLIQSG